RGLMQIDDRWHPEFVRAHRNDDHAANARYAARLLADNLRAFDGDYIAAVAAYNSGPGNVRKALRRDLPAEHYTTGRDYATDVLARARVISAALGGTASPTTPASTVDWGTVLGVAGAATLLIAPSLAGAGLLMVGLVAKAQSEGLLP
ncbi:MAG: lytic transglycosylase domain-containing protein, partial [Bacteroidota bacterium]